MNRTFCDALKDLNQFVPKFKAQQVFTSKQYTTQNSTNLEITSDWFNKLGFAVSLQRIPIVIHIAGTKGKGSTATFCENILRKRGLKTVLYTSPHLMQICERIKVNGISISEEAFKDAFFHVKDILSLHGMYPKGTQEIKSIYFRLLTMMCFQIATAEVVDALIVETGLGGCLDSTNVLSKVSASCITSIGMDHMEILGSNIEDIAREKAGILRRGVPSITTAANHHNPKIWGAFMQVAKNHSAPHPHVSKDYVNSSVKLGIDGAHMYENANLAVGVCRLALHERFFSNSDVICPVEQCALGQASLFGRSQKIIDCMTQIPFYLDGAHTPESIECVAQWAQRHLEDSDYDHVVLFFYCSPPRNPKVLLDVLFRTDVFFATKIRCIYFMLPGSTEPSFSDSLEPPNDAQFSWPDNNTCSAMMRKSLVLKEQTFYDVMDELVNLYPPNRIAVLVTGSLYLVGDVLTFLKKRGCKC